MHGPRLATIYVPLFPLAARLRCEPELQGEAVAVFEGNGHGARVVAASRLARRAGIRPGATLAQARACMPKLVARARDPEGERAAQETLLELAEGFSPRVEDAGEGIAYLDVRGLARHFPGESPEEDLGHALIRALEAMGLPGRVGIASSKLAARVAAGLPRSPTVIPRGDEAAFLAPLPLSRLAPELEIAATLERWGIRSIGELARLPQAQVISRLGEMGRELHATARGLDPRPLVARTPPPDFREGMRLEWPLVNLEPFLFIARTALERLCQRLAARGLGCRALQLQLELEPEGFYDRRLELPAPTREAKTLLTLVRLELEANTPGAPVVGFSFVAEPDAPRLAQLTLFGPATLSPDKLATTLARLFALLGNGRVGSPSRAAGHRPERFRLVEYVPPPPPKVRPEERSGHGLLAVRVLRPPVEIEVIEQLPPPAGRYAPTNPPVHAGAIAEPAARIPRAQTLACESLYRRGAWNGLQPTEVHTVLQDGEKKTMRIDGTVRIASGPWELEETWWSESPVERDYWDVELESGGLYRIYRERRTGQWFADGVYD